MQHTEQKPSLLVVDFDTTHEVYRTKHIRVFRLFKNYNKYR